MKAFKLFTTFLIFTLFTGVVFTSCSSDDDEGNSSIVGTWEEADGGYSITFYENGTFIDDEGDGTYIVNKNEITLIYEDGETFTSTFSINGNTLAVTDEDGDSFKLTRVSIVGTWLYEEGSNYTQTLTLSSNGKFTLVEKDSGDSYTDTGTYVYSYNYLVLNYGNNEYESFTIISLTSSKLIARREDSTRNMTFTKQ